MKKTLSIIIACAALLTLFSGCNSLKGIAGNTSLSDIAGLVNMGFGDGPDGPFKITKTTTKNPTLVIQNDTDRTITVKATGPVKKTFVIKTKKSESAVVESGNYHFVATAPNTDGCQGDAELGTFKEYRWIFVIQ